jgi:hypothetical protein
MSAATMYMTLLRQRSGGVSVSVVSDPTVNVAPVIGATPDVTPAVWSAGATDTERWEMADTDAGPWSTVSDMPARTTPYTSQTFGKVLRFVEAQGGVEAVSEATAAVVISVDFTALSNGALPSYFTAPAWSISSAKAVNVPTYAASVLTDGDMEAVGVTSWSAVATPTTREKSGAQVFAGSQSLRIVTDAANEGAFQAFTAANGGWYRFRLATYAAAGNAALRHTLGGSTQAVGNTAASWLQIVTTCYHALAASSQQLQAVQITAGAEGFFDAAAVERADWASMLSTVNSGQGDVVLRAAMTQAIVHTQVGLILSLDSVASPQNYVMVFLWWFSGGTSLRIGVIKCVNGTVSQVALPAPGGYGAGNELEVRKAGTTYGVYYNTAHIADYTISDASIVSNTIHGFFSPYGGNSLNSFFAVREVAVLAHVYAGSSISGSTAPVNYRDLTQDWVRANLITYAPTFTTAAQGGTNTWNHLTRLQADVLDAAPEVVTFDMANDINRTIDHASMEAFIRRVWTALPDARIAVFLFPRVTDHNVNASVDNYENAAIMAAVMATCEHYGVTVIDFAAELRRLVNEEGHDLNEYLGDSVHPGDGGHQLAASMLEAELPVLYAAESMKPETLPARLYAESEDYEYAPTLKNGTDYDGRTGTWSDTGTRTESSETDATITFSATCSTYGIFRNDFTSSSNPAVYVSIDGGAYVGVTVTQNGQPITGGRGAHTITFKVGSGTVRIDEFWAI